jgi:hypothetical protein
MKSALSSPRRLIDDKAGSQMLGVSRSQFRTWVARGLIARVRLPGENGELRRLLVEEADVIALIDRYKRRQSS